MLSTGWTSRSCGQPASLFTFLELKSKHAFLLGNLSWQSASIWLSWLLWISSNNGSTMPAGFTSLESEAEGRYKWQPPGQLKSRGLVLCYHLSIGPFGTPRPREKVRIGRSPSSCFDCFRVLNHGGQPTSYKKHLPGFEWKRCLAGNWSWVYNKLPLLPCHPKDFPSDSRKLGCQHLGEELQLACPTKMWPAKVARFNLAPSILHPNFPHCLPAGSESVVKEPGGSKAGTYENCKM